MRMTTNYKGVKFRTVTKSYGTHTSAFVHIIGPRFHKIIKAEPGWMQKAIDYVELRLQGRIHPKF